MEERGRNRRGRGGYLPSATPDLVLLLLPLATPWYQEWCLLLLTLLNHFQCYFLCVYKTVNHAPFGVGGYGVKYRGNIQIAGKEDHCDRANDNFAAFYLATTHLSSGGIDGYASVSLSFSFVLTRANKKFKTNWMIKLLFRPFKTSISRETGLL